MSLKTIIVDDEDLSVDLLKDFCSKIHLMKVLATFDSAINAMEYLEHHEIDLILLDIEMPYLSGIQFIEGMENPPMVVFITAYPQYALEGFRLNAIDYLLKPYLFDRFKQSVEKAADYWKYRQFLKNPLTPVEQKIDFIYVKSNYQVIKICFDDIFYIEGLKQYIKIFTTNKMIITLETMRHIESNLPASEFIRVHKSFIVSKRKITSHSRNEITVKNKKIPVGRKYRENMHLLLNALVS